MNEETNKLLIDLQVKAQNVELQFNILRGKYAALDQENEENKKTINELKIKNAELDDFDKSQSKKLLEKISELETLNNFLTGRNEKLAKEIDEFNLCGSTVAKSTYNEVVNENAILKSQIEKMKDCMTCIHNLDSQYFCTCDLGPEEQSKCCYKNNRDKWELAE